MRRHSSNQPRTVPYALPEMSLVADLCLAAEAVEVQGLVSCSASVIACSAKLAELPQARWEPVLHMAIDVTTVRAGTGATSRLHALAEVIEALDVN